MIPPDGAGPGEPDADAGRPARYRFGLVLLLTFVVVVYEILAPDADWARAIVIAVQSASLLVVIATSRAREEIRRKRALVAGIGAALLVIGAASGALPVGVALLVIALLTAAIPPALVGGLLRLIRSHGVTVPAVSGALAVYLLVGLLFANMIGFVTHVDSSPYFAQGTDVSSGDRVYYSFTVMTTTGLGDFTAATALGHAIAVVEMLIGQLYLVTVIGILAANLNRQRA